MEISSSYKSALFQFSYIKNFSVKQEKSNLHVLTTWAWDCIDVANSEFIKSFFSIPKPAFTILRNWTYNIGYKFEIYQLYYIINTSHGNFFIYVKML